MVKFSRIFLFLGSICLVNPVLAADIDDDDDDGDYSAAPVVYKARVSRQQKALVKKTAKSAIQPTEELAEVDDDDDGDYSAAPVVYKKKVSKQAKTQAKQKIKPQVKKQSMAKLAIAKAAAAKAKWNSRSDIDPFE